jgi:hypothetical protein
MPKEICIRAKNTASMIFEFCYCSECRVKWAAAIFYTYGNPKPVISKIEAQVEARGYPLDEEAQALLDSVKNGTAPREGT